MHLLILGANGFIGSNLIEHILARKPGWNIAALDLGRGKLGVLADHANVTFHQADMRASQAWIAEQVARADAVLPLVAIATPATYVSDPLAVFELDFEANLAVVRECVKQGKRLIFPSTSEVYGMSDDLPYDEEESRLVTGPINKQRWIYSCSKQMMDRVIAACAQRDGLRYTLFRPFNWIGPKQDDVWSNKGNSSRVVSQFLSQILRGQDIQIVGDGSQKRCFLYIDDAMDALLRIIENKDECAEGRIFNIGHPGNEASIRELAENLLGLVKSRPGYEKTATQIRLTSAEEYYGKGYQDVARRVPSIARAEKHLDWRPAIPLAAALEKTVDYYLRNKPAQPG